MEALHTAPHWTNQTIDNWIRWAPNQWSLRIPRPEGFHFTPGHYARLGLPAHSTTDIVWRPYSIVSAPDDKHLEFLVTLIPDGLFTGQLAHLEAGANILLDPAVMGFFVESQLAPGRTLWMLFTGSGLGPYISMLREGGVLKRYESIFVVHSVRTAAELAYANELKALAARHPGVLRYVPVVTREPGNGYLARRIPTMIGDGSLEVLLESALDPAFARVMVCGNPQFTGDMRALLRDKSFQPCRRGLIGSMLFENYWQ
ncbi:MAG: ferredoxin--NADP reductase [Rhodocyclaceae bacterium]